MTILQAVILGIVQGLTEFLPVSSSGHLVLVEHLLGVPVTDDITFEVFVHFGTLLSVVVVFGKDIVEMLKSFLEAVRGIHLTKKYYQENEYFRLAVYIPLASIPAAIVGIRYEDEISAAFTDPKLVAVMLIFTGLILYLTRLSRPAEPKSIGLLQALLVGVAQAVAIIPGISRSGSTMSMAIYLRVTPIQAARFSFLLSVPVIAGATLLKTKDLASGGFTLGYMVPILVGTMVAFLSGYVAIKFLFRIIEKGRFIFFSYYCLVVGTLGIIFI